MQDNDNDADDKYFSDLYASLKQEQPSSELDEKILTAAREATTKDDTSTLIPKKAGGPFSGKWSVPVSLAAVMVLSVTVVVMIERERPYSLTSEPEPTRQEPQSQSSELAKPAAKLRPSQSIAKESARPADEEADSARLQALQKSEPLRLQQQVAPTPAQPRAALSDSDSATKSVARSVASPKPEAATAPHEAKAKPVTPPRLKLVETETVKKMDTESTKRAQREVQAGKAPVSENKAQTETQPPVAMIKDEVAKPVPVPPVEQQATASDDTQGQVKSAEVIPADNDVKNEITAQSKIETQTEIQSQTPLAAVAATGETAPSESESPIASTESASATASISAIEQAQDVATEPPAVAAVDKDQHKAVTEDSQAQIPALAAEAETETSIAAVQSSEENANEQRALEEGNTPSFAAAASDPAKIAENDRLEPQCMQMSQQACLKSSSCVLQQQADDKSYVCRAAVNACESNFSQALNTKEDCEKRPECQYVPADCYCEPEQDCSCDSGPPAMCVPKSVE
ncbi:hypothetical protein [Kaarinaea lacus]